MKIAFRLNRRLSQPMLVVIRLAFILLLMAFCRFLFYLFNISSFTHLNLFELSRLLFIGLRYDASVIAYFNLPYIVFALIPFAFRYHRIYQLILNILFVITNTILIGVNLVDLVFYRYISKRTTTEIEEFFFNPAENTGGLLWQFILDFWYIVLILLVLTVLIIRFTQYFITKSPSPIRRWRWYSFQVFLFLLFIFITVIAARGGFQLKPIGLLSAAQYTESRNIPLLINTPFSIIKTMGSKSLERKSYFTEEELKQIYTPEHQFNYEEAERDSLNIKDYNVVLIILESFGREYIGYYTEREESLSPFLDSLFNKGTSFQGYANGKRSIEALPSILAGIPSLMPADYPSSNFINNQLEGMGQLLKNEGYTTAFFHGGNNGTMGFDYFSAMAGFDHYFGRNEYGSNEHFDGKWGIFDEAFLQYTAAELNKFKTPFASVIFTLSSHHPYTLPDEYKHSFPHAKNEMEATFAYVDYSLKQFFETAKQQSWFENSIFIFTADHTPEKTHLNTGSHFEKLYAVPIVFYIPEQQIEVERKTAQHIDILPSLMWLLQSEQAVFSFGSNLFSPKAEEDIFVLNYMSGMYHIMCNDTLAISDGDSIFELYALADDPDLENNLIHSQASQSEDLQQFIRAVVQQYNNRMIDNQLFTKSTQSE